MTRISTFRVIVMAASIALWLSPFVRAFRLFGYARDVFIETGSINAANDYTFSQQLLLSYTFSLAVAILLTWLMFRSRAWLLALPLAGSFLIGADVLRLRPESVIVLFPTMFPFRPAGFSVIVAVVAIGILMWHRYKNHDERASRNAA